MRPREHFWTPRRLIELRKAAKKLSDEQLEKQFGRPIDEIQQAKRYITNTAKLKLGKRKEKIGRRTVTVTVFAAAHAEGARYDRHSWSGQSLL